MKHLRKLVCAGTLLVLGGPAWGDVIYDSYGNANGYAFTLANGQEIGNQLTIPTGVWTLTNFTIEYYSPQTFFTSQVGIDVRFYANDGPATNGFATPGATPFYDSGWFYNTALGGMPANGYQVVTYDITDFSGGLPLNMPTANLTFTITFTNLDGGNVVELPLANNQAGISYGDYWLNNGGAWTLMTNNASGAANFVVNFSGVPEPSSLALAALGGALVWGGRWLRRKR
jgi:PEP-CTERM motif